MVIQHILTVAIIGVCTVCKEVSSEYNITGYWGVFKEMRDLVYLQFPQECKYWAKAFYFVYDDCVNAGGKYLKPSSDNKM